MFGTSRSQSGMVVAPHAAASEAGRAVLADGGNAVEAAIAVAATLAVVYPHMNSIGGDGFWLIHRPGRSVTAIDACGAAAAKADLALYNGLDSIPWRGPLAANTVAGTVSGWKMALEIVPGDLPLSRILADAISHASAGIDVTAGGAAIAVEKSNELRSLPGAYATVFEPAGVPLAKGDLLRQPALADTLRRMAADGLDGFYRGELSVDIAADLAMLGCPVSAHDLSIHWAIETEPLTLTVNGARLFNHQPPTQGIASLMILALADRMDLGANGTFCHIHGLVEATKQAFLWRDAYCEDPVHMIMDPRKLLADRDALDALVERIDPKRALPWPQSSQYGDTVWFGAADKNGTVVSVIQSTYFEFGSGVVLPRTGITWQNRGASFRLNEGGWNALKPGRKPFHTLNPALAHFADGRVMSYGTMGGEGQPQTQAAIFTRYARHQVGLAEAIAQPRWLLGRTWGENSTTLKIEEGFVPALYEELSQAGHVLERVPPVNSMMGHAGAIVVGEGWFEGASDPRCDGLAVGL